MTPTILGQPIRLPRYHREPPAAVLCGLDAWARQGGHLREHRERLAWRYLLSLGSGRLQAQAEAERLLAVRRTRREP